MGYRIVSGSAYSTPGSAAMRREVADTEAPERLPGSLTTTEPSEVRPFRPTFSPASRETSAVTGAAPSAYLTMIWSVALESAPLAGTGVGTTLLPTGAAPTGAASPVAATSATVAPATSRLTA